jgi:acyl-CoA thioesterase-2
MTQTRNDVMGWLDLERIDRDIYRGRPSGWRRAGSLYGGLVAAQALMAAARTVSEERTPHSLHGYFLRPGDPNEPVVFRVDRDRDGRSFSARRVTALQDGRVIWDMACSFHEPVDGPEYVHPAADVIGPEQSLALIQHMHPIIEVRVPPGGQDGPPAMPVDQAWVRVSVPLDDDVLVHACMHTYTSDITTGFAQLLDPGIPPAGPSIDHSLWFHRLSRADDWILYDGSPERVGSHRGLYTGTARDRDGNLVAVFAQEMLLRPPPDAEAPAGRAT